MKLHWKHCNIINPSVKYSIHLSRYDSSCVFSFTKRQYCSYKISMKATKSACILARCLTGVCTDSGLDCSTPLQLHRRYLLKLHRRYLLCKLSCVDFPWCYTGTSQPSLCLLHATPSSMFSYMHTPSNWCSLLLHSVEQSYQNRIFLNHYYLARNYVLIVSLHWLNTLLYIHLHAHYAMMIILLNRAVKVQFTPISIFIY